MLTTESRRPAHRLPDGLDGPASAFCSDTHDAALRVYRERICGVHQTCEDCPTPQRCRVDSCGLQRDDTRLERARLDAADDEWERRAIAAGRIAGIEV